MSDLFNVSTNPHVRSKDTTQTIMRDVLIALTPASIFGIYNFGLHALLLILVCMATCVATEAVYEKIVNKNRFGLEFIVNLWYISEKGNLQL